MTGRPGSCTAEGQAKAISTVFGAIHAANPDSKVMAYQYLQALPQIAAGASNKIWIVPAELTKALEGIGGALGGLTLGGPGSGDPARPTRSIGDEASRGGPRRRDRGGREGRRGRRGRRVDRFAGASGRTWRLGG